MADQKISELSNAGALDGSESVEVVQGGANVKTTTADIAALVGGGGHVIEDEGTPLTQRANMNFVGAGVTATDAGGKTVVTIPDGGAGKQDTLVSGTNIKTVNGTTILGSGDIDLIDDAIVNGEAKAPSQNAVFDALALKGDLANTATALTDGASIDITGQKHTLTTDEATITFSQSYTGDFTNIDVTFNTAAATWTFMAGSLCVVEGSASGNNTATIAAVSGDKIVISIWFVAASTYRIAIKNFGQ